MTDAGVKRGAVHCADTTLDFTVEGGGASALLVVGSSVYYPRTFSQRLKQTCTLVCADLPHFVQRKTPVRADSINFASYATCIDAMRRAAGLEQVAIVGHSHHGNVALEYAKRYPAAVSHVVMIGTPPVDIARTIEESERYWRTHAPESRQALLRERRLALDENDLASLPPHEAYIARYVADAPLYWHNPTYDAAWLWQDMQFELEAIRAFRDLYQVYELTWDPESLKAPVLVVMGRSDYAVPHTLWEGNLSDLDHVTIQVLDGSGHTPQLEQPDVFDEVLLDWLQCHGGCDH